MTVVRQRHGFVRPGDVVKRWLVVAAAVPTVFLGVTLGAFSALTVGARAESLPPIPEKRGAVLQVTSRADEAAAAEAARRDTVPAKKLFGAAQVAAPLAPAAIGFYSRGCLAGGEELEVDGPAWQAMRLSRNRNWGHPKLVKAVRQLAIDVKRLDEWPGLLVGDLAQPRGGPMLTGHQSHQIGLDADIWLTPMPNRRLTRKEREQLSATSMLGADKISVNSSVWTTSHVRLIRRAALNADVERILVHPAIKKALCEGAKTVGGSDA